MRFGSAWLAFYSLLASSAVTTLQAANVRNRNVEVFHNVAKIGAGSAIATSIVVLLCSLLALQVTLRVIAKTMQKASGQE